MKLKPSDRKQSDRALSQLDRLYDRLVHWLYERQNPGRARPLADRLECLLTTLDPQQESIFGEECRSLIHEARGEASKAIRHRRNEIRLIRRLHALADKSEDAAFLFGQYSFADLRDRLTLLAMLYHASGDLDKALTTLRESIEFCKKRRIRFDAKAMFRDYEEEMQRSTS
jgi:tetratricopeptide (TPR) repeat protein